MKLDRNTYGDTPAAIYLAEYLNTLGDKILARKVGCMIAESRTALNELKNARDNTHVSQKTFGMIINMMREKTEKVIEHHREKGLDNLVMNLTQNIIFGELKKELRTAPIRTHLVKHEKRAIALKESLIKNIGYLGNEAYLELKKKINHIDNLRTSKNIELHGTFMAVTPDVLKERSRKKLARQGKPNTFY